MGLSSFNAMRARKRAMEQANAKEAEPTPIEVKEVEAPTILEEIEPDEKSEKIQEKKTDAEKLKKKKD